VSFRSPRKKCAVLLTLLLALNACGQAQKDPLEAQGARLEIGVLTSLPLFWPEGAVGAALKGEDRRAAIIKSMEKRGKVRALDAIEGRALDGVGVLLLAQPRLLAPHELVRIDEWVRTGGRVVAFADPMLDWPSNLAIGDPRRPPPVTLLDPLFNHWGLTLEGDADGAGELRSLSGTKIQTRGTGRWQSKTRDCAIEKGGLVARCLLGKGHAILVADADALNGDDQGAQPLAADLPLMAALRLIDAEARRAR
jgi:hypothetical protein